VRLYQKPSYRASLKPPKCALALTLTMRYKKHGEMRIQCTFPKYSKAIIDQIDQVLGRHLGLATSEVDFIVNFDIKYRMGLEESDEEPE